MLLIPVRFNFSLRTCKGQKDTNHSVGLEEDRKVSSSISEDRKGPHPKGEGEPKLNYLGNTFTVSVNVRFREPQKLDLRWFQISAHKCLARAKTKMKQ